ncbi:alpha-L-arabinofuranosidase [Puia dinghuensis]|uniref:Alpha-L-arabinofuranosidase n=1 Tax=Puia dinghuensis TaxID=1792502 RepID=A0A8J2UI90_9BACT|nr:alpha-L-arabinofuranosidase [Puia dinghuensis]GGB20803.1 hypothetical protein GCM10011511_50700 [Puia dinghuensis]
MIKNNGIFVLLFLLTTNHSYRSGSGPAFRPTRDSVPAVLTPTSETAAPTIGFFLDSWAPKQFIRPATQPAPAPDAPAAATAPAAPAAASTLTIFADSVITRIPPVEFGHNANTWMGTMTTQLMLMLHLHNLRPHVIRWPAGSGSDAYFWNCGPGGLPADVPAQLVNKDGKKESQQWFYGKPHDGYSASLDDYYSLLKETGNEGLITVNYGYARYSTAPDPVAAAAHLAADWVRYDHGRTRYWEVGNENFGTWECGYRIDTGANKDGQPRILSGELYGKHFCVIADSMRKAAAETGATIYIGAVTVEAPPHTWDMPITRDWNKGMLRAIHGQADYYVVHNYFTPYNKNSTAGEILHEAATVPGQMMSYVVQCLGENGAAIKPVAMDEWNMFATGSRQQVSNTSGLFAVLVMGEALRSKFGLCARWDLYNGWADGNDHGLFSAGDEPGVMRWSPRPSFFYLYYMQRFLGDRLLNSRSAGDTSLRAYASSFSSGEIGTAIVNTSGKPAALAIDIRHFTPGSHFYWYSLTGEGNDEFPRKVLVNGRTATTAAGGPVDYATLPAYTAPTNGGINITVPARGAVFLVVEKK